MNYFELVPRIGTAGLDGLTLDEAAEVNAALSDVDTGAPFTGVGLPPAMLQMLAHRGVSGPTIAKLAVPASASPLAQRPRIQLAPMHPRFQPSQVPVATIGRVLDDAEFYARVRIRQLAALGDGTLPYFEIAAGATVQTKLRITRSGTVIQFSVNDNGSEIIARNLQYQQDPYEIYDGQQLGAWANKAAHRTPVQPKHIVFPASLDVELTNPGADAVRLVWTLNGIDDEAMSDYMADPDIVATMRARGIPIGSFLVSNPLG